VSILEVIRECTTEEEQTKLQLPTVPEPLVEVTRQRRNVYKKTRHALRRKQAKRRNGAAEIFEFYTEMRGTLYRFSIQECQNFKCRHLLNTTACNKKIWLPELTLIFYLKCICYIQHVIWS
jgi:hypothetical protein